MSHQQDNDLSDDYIDLTDTDTSSSSSNQVIFENNQPLVLELHDIQIDPNSPNSQNTEGPDMPEPLVPVKRRKRRINALGEEESVTSGSGSETENTSLAPSVHGAPDKFFDAHESFHAMPENQRSAPIETGIALAASEHAAIKVQEVATGRSGSQVGSVTQRPGSNAQRQQSTTISTMEKSNRQKSKTKKQQKQSKTKPAAKGKCEGQSCSTFLADLTRRFALKRRHAQLEEDEEEKKTVVQTIIDSLTNALPMKFSRRSPSKKQSPIKMDTLQNYAPELLPNTMIGVPPDDALESEMEVSELVDVPPRNMPRMPVIDSEVLKIPTKKRKVETEDVAVSTQEHDVASEIAKHVGTLKKISLIAEEFNKKTARNLKEIVDSVQEDLVKKLQEIEAEQRLSLERQQAQEANVVGSC